MYRKQFDTHDVLHLNDGIGFLSYVSYVFHEAEMTVGRACDSAMSVKAFRKGLTGKKETYLC